MATPHTRLGDCPHHTDTSDRLIATAMAVTFSPLLAARAAIAYATTGHVYEQHPRLGRNLTPITIRSFAGSAPGRRLAYLLSVARGDMCFIGPRPLDPEDAEAQPRRTPNITPGFLSPSRLRARLGIDYEPETLTCHQRLLSKDGIALTARYLIAEVLGSNGLATPATYTQLGLSITNTTMDEALTWCVNTARTRPASTLVFVNAACYNESAENPAYASALHHADRIFPDGIGAKLGARLHGVSLIANLNGTDMFPRLCERARNEGLSLFLLGARPGIAEAVAENMTSKFPGLQIAGTRHGYFTSEEESEVIATINNSGADILLIAFGVPNQELWIDQHRKQLNVGLIQGVGGLFDFYSGRIPRAPLWLREIGLEWVWRLAQEPGRMWRRYIVGNPRFLRRAWLDSRCTRHCRDHSTGQRPLLNYRDEYPKN
ncbi:WecB/TagA/CpsF family glycosyltransferase [Dermatophilus congolensis]|uniref:WecB/TagA/CpsF family glycosyltransferase n=1 Tax=Dermatophilus congolensis TaxID=1863 RepID=UPI001AAF8FFD|nr:WecB/TagA/CpsF family glycosyltransferase [Dermatophilus congolensis]